MLGPMRAVIACLMGLVAVTGALSFPATSWTQTVAPAGASPAALGAAITARAQAAGAEVGVDIRALDGSFAVGVDAAKRFHAASTMKVAVMIELFRQADAGRLSLDDTLVVTETFRSIVDGSPYRLSAADDADPSLYAALGQRRSLRDLCEAMIVVSSNLATNMLVDHVGAANVRATVHALGADGLDVQRGVEDTKAFRAGRNNTTTAAGLATLLVALANGTAASPAATAEMLAILKRQRFTEGIPAGLPDGTPVAHKTGQITHIHHDAGIVFGPRPYVVVVLVRGLDDAQASAAVIADISRLAWQAVGQP